VETVVRTSCTRDCPDACGIVAHVEDGRVVRIGGDPDHPVTRGFLCRRTSGFVEERQNDTDRLTTPLRRRNGTFDPIGWEEALDLAADRLVRFREESGPASIFHYRSGGSLGLMKHVVDLFFERFGPVTIKRGDICSGAGDAAQETDFGLEDSHDFFDLLNSRTIVLWGKNPYVSSVHLLPILREAKAKGARLVLIDPVHQRTASMCDLVLQPRPGSDFALAMGLARILFERGWTDPSASDYCDHLEAFRSMAFRSTVADRAAEADVEPREIEALAEAYGRRKPASIQVGWGVQRRANGSGTIRTMDALAAISGNLGVPGGGVSFYYHRRRPFDLSFVKGLAAAPRSIPEPLLGPEVLAAKEPPIRMIWVTAGNPVAMLPESATVARALESRDFVVVVDAFLTDTARLADLVLPTVTMLEDDDLVGAYGHHWLGNVRPVAPPPPGAKTDLEIVRGLADRVGLADEFRPSAREWKERLLRKVAPEGANLEALERGGVRNPLAPRVLFADRRFPTESGKVNLIDAPPPDVPRPTAEYPLYLTSISVDAAQASQTTESFQEGPSEATVHPDVAPVGVGEGGLARVESAVGSLVVRVRLDPRQRRDVLLLPKGGWYRKGRCANALIRASTTDAGEGAAYYDERVRLVPLGTDG